MSFTGFFQNITDVIGNKLKVTCADNPARLCDAELLSQAAETCGVTFMDALSGAWNACANFCVGGMMGRTAIEIPSSQFFSTGDSCDDSATVQCLASEIDANAGTCSSWNPTTYFMVMGIGLASCCLLVALGAGCKKALDHCDSGKYTPIPDSRDQQLRVRSLL